MFQLDLQPRLISWMTFAAKLAARYEQAGSRVHVRYSLIRMAIGRDEASQLPRNHQ